MSAKTLDAMQISNPAAAIGASGTIRYYADQDFTAFDGTQYLAGAVDSLDYFLSNTWSIVSGDLIVPSIANFPSTDDAIKGNGVRITAAIYNGGTKHKGFLFDSCRIYNSLPSTISLTQLVLANNPGLHHIPRDTETATQEWVIDYVNTVPPAAKMTAVAYGIGRLSIAAANAADPVTVGKNDYDLLGNYNVKSFGAIGDGVVDDTAAIQSAITAIPGGAVLFFPPGSYKLTSSLTVTTPIIFRGAGALNGGGGFFGTRIFGTFADYLIKFTLGGIWPGFGVEDMYLSNAHATGGGINVDRGNGPARFRDLMIAAYRGITLDPEPIASGVFTIAIDNVNCNGIGGSATGGWGVYTRGHTNFFNMDVIGHDNGLRIGGSGISIVGGRFEVNRTALVVGTRADGTANQVVGFSISGFTMEANDIGIYLRSAAGPSLSSFSIQGSVNSPSSGSVYGLISEIQNQGIISGGTFSGEFSKATIKSPGYTVFQSVKAGPNSAGAVWDITGPQSSVFVNSNYGLKHDGVETPHVTATQFVRSIGAADQVRGGKQGLNLRAIATVVPSASTFIDVVFPNLIGAGAAINTATATGSGATIPTGSYFYTATLVNEIGETPPTTISNVAVTLGQQVDITFSGVSAAQRNWRRRIYRGTVSGEYTGYFEHTFESSATFSDTGQAFTGKKNPPRGGTEWASGTEPDAVYAVTVAPAWNTAFWITAKTTTGFRVNFASAPGADSSLDWILVR